MLKSELIKIASEFNVWFTSNKLMEEIKMGRIWINDFFYRKPPFEKSKRSQYKINSHGYLHRGSKNPTTNTSGEHKTRNKSSVIKVLLQINHLAPVQRALVRLPFGCLVTWDINNNRSFVACHWLQIRGDLEAAEKLSGNTGGFSKKWRWNSWTDTGNSTHQLGVI